MSDESEYSGASGDFLNGPPSTDGGILPVAGDIRSDWRPGTSSEQLRDGISGWACGRGGDVPSGFPLGHMVVSCFDIMLFNSVRRVS
jgi:hypothetical protein